MALAHGLPDGERARREHQWLTEQETKKVIEVFTNRLEHLDLSLILNSASPLDVLFCWEQVGNRETLRRRIASHIGGSDTQFLRTLHAMRSWANSSLIGVHYPLHAKYVAFFMNADEAFSRLQRMSKHGKGARARKASELLSAWEPEVKTQPEE